VLILSVKLGLTRVLVKHKKTEDAIRGAWIQMPGWPIFAMLFPLFPHISSLYLCISPLSYHRPTWILLFSPGSWRKFFEFYTSE